MSQNISLYKAKCCILGLMKKVYIELIDGIPYIPLLYPNLGAEERDSILFLNKAFRYLKDPIVSLVDSPEDAECIVLPHNYPSLRGRADYVRRQYELATTLQKPFVVFWHGDSDEPFPHEEATVFRTSQYRSALRKNEIMMPAYADDLLAEELALRKKHEGKPIIGFCGWADYKNLKNYVGTILKNSLIEAGHLIGWRNDARLKGITYRMKALKHLQKSTHIEPNFIIRSSYSGHASTIKTDAETARREYKENLLSSDYALVIKGDGNYSYRFYEALSLGRIPVLLDTECVLPLEDVIQYDEFILRIPYYDLYRIDEIVAQHYASISPQEFSVMQQKARHAFETYLRVDAFLAHAVQHLF